MRKMMQLALIVGSLWAAQSAGAVTYRVGINGWPAPGGGIGGTTGHETSPSGLTRTFYNWDIEGMTGSPTGKLYHVLDKTAPLTIDPATGTVTGTLVPVYSGDPSIGTRLVADGSDTITGLSSLPSGLFPGVTPINPDPNTYTDFGYVGATGAIPVRTTITGSWSTSVLGAPWASSDLLDSTTDIPSGMAALLPEDAWLIDLAKNQSYTIRSLAQIDGQWMARGAVWDYLLQKFISANSDPMLTDENKAFFAYRFYAWKYSYGQNSDYSMKNGFKFVWEDWAVSPPPVGDPIARMSVLDDYGRVIGEVSWEPGNEASYRQAMETAARLAVPEPHALSVLGIALAALALRKRFGSRLA